jgi:hypothetical protein
MRPRWALQRNEADGAARGREPDRFSADARRLPEGAVEKLGPDACGPGGVHRLLAPLWSRFFHPPSETIPPNQSRAYYDGDDDPKARALTKFAREAARRTYEAAATERADPTAASA